MKLSEKQGQFLMDVALLVQWVNSQGWYVTGKELLRTKEQQRLYYEQGKTKTMNSQHGKGLAIDLILFIDGKVTWRIEDYKPLGEFWESIRPENRWGGSWRGRVERGESTFIDAVHFERTG